MRKSNFKFFAAMSTVLVLLVGCVPQSTDTADDNKPIVIGVGQCCEVLDPANSYSPQDWVYMMQIYPALINAVPETDELVLDAAESAELINPETMRIKVRDGLTFSNGNALTASDAVFSLNRQINIASENGPSPLWNNIKSITLLDDLNLEIVTTVPNDVTLKKVLASIFGLIVDEEVFSFDRVMENDEILAAQSYAGPYTLEAFESGSFLSLIPNPTYKGVWGAPKNSGVIVRSYQENSNIVSDFKNGTLDAAVAYHRTIAPGLVALASENYAVAYPGPTVQAISMFVNFVNFPYGRASESPDEEKAAAVRKALSILIDREQLSKEAYFDLYKPMYAAVPSDIQFSIGNEIAKSTTLNDEEKISSARRVLELAGVKYPINLDILFSSSRWGEVSLRLTALLRDQLEKGSLFSISLSDVEWGERQDRRKSGNFELLIQMWGADFADADNYLTPMVVTDSRINNGYSNSRVDALAIEQAAAATDEVREALLGEMQQILNADLPLIPLISGGPILFARPEIRNADIFVNREHKYLFSYLSR